MYKHRILLFVPHREPALIHCIREVFGERGISHLIDPTPAQMQHCSPDTVVLRFIPRHIRQELCADLLLYDTMSEKENEEAADFSGVHFNNLLISNGDISSAPSFALGITAYPITYGLAQKCSLTVSSIDRSEKLKLTCCLQRSITTLGGKTIEPQEISLQLSEAGTNTYDAMAALCLALVVE